MATKKFSFKNTKDVTFAWVEQLYKDSYEDKKCKVTAVIRAKSQGKPWHDITTDASAAKTVVEMAARGFDEVRLVVKVPNGHTYINMPINELNKDWKYPKPKVS